MPLIISNPNRLLSGALQIRANSSAYLKLRGTLQLRANSSAYAKLRGTLMLSSSSATRILTGLLRVQARTGLYQTSGRLDLIANTHPAQTGGSVVFFGSRSLFYRVSGLGGLNVVSFDYSHTAQGRELSLVLAGAVIIPRNTPLGLTLSSDEGGSLSFGSVPADGEYEIERLPNGAARTRVRGADREYGLLTNTRLPELIPWANNPSREVAAPGYRSATRQVIGVNSVLIIAFRTAGQTLELSGGALSEQQWEETRREYSTAGKTPLQVWQESYGLLNYELVRTGANQWRGFAPDESVSTMQPDRKRLLPYGQSRQILQYPANVRVQGGDIFTSIQSYLQTVAQTGELPDQIVGTDGVKAKVEVRDPQTALMEVSQSAVLRGTTTEGGRKTQYAVMKAGGRVTLSAELVTGDVEAVLELGYDVASPLPVRKFLSVALALSTTENTYLSADSSTLAETKTSKRRYAYAYNTALAPAVIPAPLTLTAQAGALLGQEETLEQFVWSHQGGHLRQKTTTENKVTALGQQNADDATATSPPVALERNTTVTVETWTPVGAGLWRHGVTRSQAAKLPVLDLTGGDWTKQIAVPSVSVFSEITDNAPPSVSDSNIPNPDAQGQQAGSPPAPAFPVPPPFQYLRDVNVLTVLLGGDGLNAELNLPMVEDNNRTLLGNLGVLWGKELKPRTTKTFKTVAPERLTPRITVLGYGLVRSVRASGSAASFSLEATCEEHDL